MNKFIKYTGIGFIAIVLFAGAASLLALLVMWLWNITIPQIFGLCTLSYWQALGLYVLSSMLFKDSFIYKGK